MNLVPAYVALGSNLRDPAAQVKAGVEELAMLPDTRLVQVSSLYRTAPVGFLDQPDFVNAVALIETALTPRTLLDALLAIERRYGRVRDFPNAPRTLDLDILLFGDEPYRDDALTIPHPRLHERAFVLVPLAEIAPDTIVPGLQSASELVARVDASGIEKLESAA
ncbi:MAG TPA: 2-amino-4-hydroxy-6-hydroxymethyldihydropteridine diphosphokinase [Burkholderiales bacterium]|nr:2-amino-4-hydroxy-6-hydroxymethyldihydropteridine diphosphokinase [Burkholderiales bacterium]